MRLIKILLLPLLISGCANGLLGSLVDTSAYQQSVVANSAQSRYHDPHPPTPRHDYDTRFYVGGKVYTYEDLGFENARDYDRWHDRTDPTMSDFNAYEYRSSSYRYAKKGKLGSVHRRIAEYQHRDRGE